MDLQQIPLFAALTKRMAWLSDRQGLLATNVANADTPGYVAKDMKAPDFRQLLSQSNTQVSLATTQPGHIPVKRNIMDDASETTVDETPAEGNKVTLEQEMMKVSQTANDFAFVTTIYRANINMLKTVLGRSS